jgi:hypothetical protein
MDIFLIKILAAFLALSQVTTRPDAIATSFNPDRDAAAVTQIMRDGCAHMRKAFDVESIDLDELIKTAMDPQRFLRGDRGVARAEVRRPDPGLPPALQERGHQGFASRYRRHRP